MFSYVSPWFSMVFPMFSLKFTSDRHGFGNLHIAAVGEAVEDHRANPLAGDLGDQADIGRSICVDSLGFHVRFPLGWFIQVHGEIHCTHETMIHWVDKKGNLNRKFHDFPMIHMAFSVIIFPGKPITNWLVVDLALWKIWKSVWIIIPHIWKKQTMFQTTNQLVNIGRIK